jgi:hypothetical protein
MVDVKETWTISHEVIGAAIEVHKASARDCQIRLRSLIKLKLRHIPFERQVPG